MANRAKPTAKGPMFPNDGVPIATAYTVDTSTNVITVSHPKICPTAGTKHDNQGCVQPPKESEQQKIKAKRLLMHAVTYVTGDMRKL